MQVIFNNAEQEFQKVLDSMGMRPGPWQNWKCLHIETPDLEDYKVNPDLMAYAEAIVDTFLPDYDGTVFFCGVQDLYLMARNIQSDFLEEIGHELSSSLFLERGDRARLRVYDLSSETLELIFTLCGKGRLFKVMENTIVPEIPEQMFAGKPGSECIGPAIRVLLIEDDQSTRWIVRKALKEVCDLATAPNLLLSQKKILSFQPNLIFLDIDLPDGNGLAILDWLSMEQMTADVVMFSSHNTMDNISTAMAAGAKGFISKPFAKSQLIEHVHGCGSCH